MNSAHEMVGQGPSIELNLSASKQIGKISVALYSEGTRAYHFLLSGTGSRDLLPTSTSNPSALSFFNTADATELIPEVISVKPPKTSRKSFTALPETTRAGYRFQG